MRVLIIGAGGHGQVVADILLAELRSGDTDTQPIGFLDDDITLHGCTFLGLPVLGSLAQVSRIEHEAVVVAIGVNRTRQRISQRLQAQGNRFVRAIHPAAIIGSGVEIATGTMVCAGVVVNTGAHIGQGVILNTGCTVDHHNHIADYSHIAPGVHLGGDVTIGEGTLVGVGATIMPQRRVGAWSVVGAGAAVIEDVRAGKRVIGVPAREYLHQGSR
jgi:sugar O-acyltransferase (sialic acid O-acetyltransferase NeuD family)